MDEIVSSDRTTADAEPFCLDWLPLPVHWLLFVAVMPVLWFTLGILWCPRFAEAIVPPCRWWAV